VRACVQCGLSIGETATFCQVCGARVEPGAGTAAAERPGPAADAPATDPLTAEGAPAAESPSTDSPVGVAGHAAGEPDAGRSARDPDVARARRMFEVSGLLQDAAECEEKDAARAADLYRAAILACLESTDESLGAQDVRRDLLCGFDRLSRVLERGGLPEEALDVLDAAASLGLLDLQDEAAQGYPGVLRDRLEGLRRARQGDSAPL
jgi:hypothetical protein